MAWPSAADFRVALEHPHRCFHDPDLRRGQAALDSQGQPIRRTGTNSEVYQIYCPGTRTRWAVKCFTRGWPEAAQHYLALTSPLWQAGLQELGEFFFLERGICVRGRFFPAIKMRWIDGLPLNEFIGDHVDQPHVLRQLAEQWVKLTIHLHKAGIAHGQLQHDHILVAPPAPDHPIALRLVDYDGLFIKERAGSKPFELGNANYQHPQRLFQETYDAGIDRFSQLLIYTAIQATAAAGRSLWQAHDGGDNLLFREKDFQEPESSAIFQELWRSPDPVVHTLAGHLLLASQGAVLEVPLLEKLADDVQALTLAEPRSASDLCFTVAQRQSIISLLANEGDMASAPTKVARKVASAASKQTFGILIDAEETETLSAPVTGEFDLFVESDPDLVLPPPMPSSPPPLPQEALPFALPADPEVEALVRAFRFDAWMPERIAIMKVTGFVHDMKGEIVESVPGLIRVHMLDPFARTKPKPALCTLFGLAPKEPLPPRVLAVVDLHMQHKDNGQQRLVNISVRILPGAVRELYETAEWGLYCEKLFCELRGFLIGGQ